MYIEEPPPSNKEKLVVVVEQNVFLESIHKKLNMSLSIKESEELLNEFKVYLEQVDANTTRKNKISSSSDRLTVYAKWFYFCNIMSTTIGKGFKLKIMYQSITIFVKVCKKSNFL